MFGGECPSFLFPIFVPYICRAPPSGGALLLAIYCSIVLLPSGSGFSWFVFVGEGFGRLSTMFWGSREGDSQIFEVFWKFFKDFSAPIKRTD